MHPTYNDRMQLPASAESNLGYSAMADHFSTSALLPEYIYLHSPHDLRTPQALADMEQMAQRVAQLPNVAEVRGITRPTGQPLDQTKVSYQAGQVGAKLADASTTINGKTGDLDALSGGAHQLATSLAGVRDQVDQAGRSVTAMTGTLNQVRQQLNTAVATANDGRPAVDGVVDAAAPMLAALNDSPQCDADASCSAGRAELQQLAAGTPNPDASANALVATAQSVNAMLQSAGNDGTAAVQQKIAQMERGANALADGSAQLADGVQALVDQTKQMGAGMTPGCGLADVDQARRVGSRRWRACTSRRSC